MTPIPRAFSGLTLTAENAYSSSTTLTSLMWKIWTTVHRFPQQQQQRPDPCLAAGTDGTLWIYRRTDLYTDDGEMGPSLSELIQLDAHGTLLRTIIPANEEDPNSTGDWGYSHLDTLLSDDKATSIPTIIRQSMFTGRMAASFSANPLTSFPAISASSLPVKSAH